MPPERPLEQMGGFSPSTGDPLARWLSEWIPDASRTDNLRKLASSGAPERHLFVLVHGSRENAEALREEIAAVLTPLGLRLSPAKTRIVHMSETFDFLGFRIQWRRKQGTGQWHVYTFISGRAIRSVKAKIRALTGRTSQQDLGYVLTRLNQIMHGWANYFRHAVAQHTLDMLDNFTWWRLIRMLRARHHWRWKDVRREFVTPAGSWRPITAGTIELKRIAAIPITRYRYHAGNIPSPWVPKPA
jgi:RNA-directed DNA polymerase